VGPMKDDAKWASALSSTLSWSHPAPFGKSCWIFLTMSFVRPASCSFTIRGRCGVDGVDDAEAVCYPAFLHNFFGASGDVDELCSVSR